MFSSLYETCLTILNYKLSYLEFYATVFGLASTYLATQKHWLTWPIGLVNIVLSFFLFHWFQLYADMLLQIFYFILSIFGWIYWRKAQEEKTAQKKLNNLEIGWGTLFVIVTTLALGIVQVYLPTLLPQLFKLASTYPFWDASIVALSIYATFLLAKQRRENWIVWLLVNSLASTLYFVKEMYFTGSMYVVFFFLALFGIWKWKKIKITDPK
jgi:nicotinamide mononucleotide transporter